MKINTLGNIVFTKKLFIETINEIEKITEVLDEVGFINQDVIY